jgi:hypothetical protein
LLVSRGSCGIKNVRKSQSGQSVAHPDQTQRDKCNSDKTTRQRCDGQFVSYRHLDIRFASQDVISTPQNRYRAKSRQQQANEPLHCSPNCGL